MGKLLEEGVLMKEHDYMFLRDDIGGVKIKILQSCTGKKLFFSYVFDLFGNRYSDNKYWITTGKKTLDEALNECIEGIKGVDYDELFPKKEPNLTIKTFNQE